MLASLFAAGDYLVYWLDRELHKLGRAGVFGLVMAAWCMYSVASCTAYLIEHH